MANLVLGPLLRHVSDTTATIWVETDAAVHGRGARAPRQHVHRGRPPLRPGDRGGPDPRDGHAVHVLLDGETCWPPPVERFPASVIRTHDGGPLRILFGSCRTAAPHEPPWTLEFDHDDRARGVDAVWAHGLRMLEQPPEEWPHLLLFVGDQVYADDSSPQTRARVERRRGHLADDDRYPPLDDVADFEEYTWLYHEAWLPEVERWMLSVVPSAMIFDDHDMIDDWNTSASWLDDIRQQPWWKDRVVGGFMSYWVYQHLGNLSPKEIRAEGMLDSFVELGDATTALTAWAEETERASGVPGGYRFSFYRDLGPVRLVVIDSRDRTRAGTRREEHGRRRRVDVDRRARRRRVRAPRAGDVGAGRHAGRVARPRAVGRAPVQRRVGQAVRPGRRADPPRRRPRGLVGVPRQLSSPDGPRPRRGHAACAARARSAGNRDDPVRRRALQLPITRLVRRRARTVRRR